MADLSTCVKPTCAVTVDGDVATCPKCGGPMRAVREPRWRGWVLVMCGLFLAGLMGAITFFLWPTLSDPAAAIADGDFTGTVEQARMMLLLFAVIIGFGLLCLVNGIHQIVTGEQSKPFVIVTVALFFAMLAVCWFLLRADKG